MAPRANWKGFLRLSLVTCPVALYPATSDAEKISFNQINRATGHRIKYLKVDADTGEEVAADDIMKGYKVDTDSYIEITKDELDALALESTRTIEIDQFVPKTEIDELFHLRPYFVVPDGKVGHDAYAVIRETIRAMDKVALARVVLTNREHIIALQARDNGLMGMLLRYPYEVRDASEYFDDIQEVKITKDMLDLAKHIVEQKSGHFEPEGFEDHYEAALTELINKKRNGQPIAAKARPKGDNVVDLMEALRRSIGAASGATARRQARCGRQAGQGQEAQSRRRPEGNAAADQRLRSGGEGRIGKGEEAAGSDDGESPQGGVARRRSVHRICSVHRIKGGHSGAAAAIAAGEPGISACTAVGKGAPAPCPRAWDCRMRPTWARFALPTLRLRSDQERARSGLWL